MEGKRNKQKKKDHQDPMGVIDARPLIVLTFARFSLLGVMKKR